MDAKITIVSKRRSGDAAEVVVRFVVNEEPHSPPRIIEKVFLVELSPDMEEPEIDRLALAHAMKSFDKAFPIQD